ncbi:hypothetical protein ACLKMH_16145 [Psychromonas sp. KJ10-10]|uniref:hypothetical protein n=1 Tax=Psychromonas sp. KJ10-10 TaxID=3391823 RepID=UPI0039B619EE
MSEEIRTEFIDRIECLRARISSRYNILNLEAIWLFVATLGCWSVDQKIIQIFALLIVLVFFSSKVSKDKKYDISTVQASKALRADIEASVLEGDSKEARLYNLDDIDKNLLGLKGIYKSTPMFLISYGFWIVSAITFAFRFFSVQ